MNNYSRFFWTQREFSNSKKKKKEVRKILPKELSLVIFITYEYCTVATVSNIIRGCIFNGSNFNEQTENIG